MSEIITAESTSGNVRVTAESRPSGTAYLSIGYGKDMEKSITYGNFAKEDPRDETGAKVGGGAYLNMYNKKTDETNALNFCSISVDVLNTPDAETTTPTNWAGDDKVYEKARTVFEGALDTFDEKFQEERRELAENPDFVKAMDTVREDMAKQDVDVNHLIDGAGGHLIRTDAKRNESLSPSTATWDNYLGEMKHMVDDPGLSELNPEMELTEPSAENIQELNTDEFTTGVSEDSPILETEEPPSPPQDSSPSMGM